MRHDGRVVDNIRGARDDEHLVCVDILRTIHIPIAAQNQARRVWV
jgi:hypothetical protein